MKLLILPLFICILASCSKADDLLYDTPENICFNFPVENKDSVIYTFAYTPDKPLDTVWLPVRISGLRRSAERHFKVTVMKDSSTAQEGLHYEALKDLYVMPADSGRAKVPVVIYNKDAALLEKSVSLRFLLQSTDDFGTSINDLLKGKLVFSSALELPDWWATGQWMSPATYSRTKHQLFLIATGVTSLTTGTAGGLDAPKNLYLVSLLTNLLNDPFTWVNRNADKGYVIEKAAGSEDYHFFSQANPARKFLYKKNAVGIGYNFIDENGAIITN